MKRWKDVRPQKNPQVQSMFKLDELNTERYQIVHLNTLDPSKISEFQITNPKGLGLERYFKEWALREEDNNEARTYVLVDLKANGMIAGFFTLKTGLITVSRGIFSSFDTYPGIELANFAVNDNYKKAYGVIPKMGSYMFDSFILPIVKDISSRVGAKYLYIYALPENRLMEHYQTMGFSKLPKKQAKFVYRHVKPAYDKYCVFMWQPIN